MNSPGGDGERSARRWANDIAQLALGRRCEYPSAPLAHRAWEDLRSELAGAGLEGLLISAVADRIFPATAGQRSELAELEVRLVLHDEALSALTCLISRELTSAGIEHRLLKGLAVGRLDYPDPLWRPAGDIDILVRPEDYSAAANVLRHAGGQVPLMTANAKSIAVVIGSIEVDLHRRIVAGPVGHLAADGWFDDRRTVELDGTNVPALGRELAFLHACLNAVSNEWALTARPLLDVAVLLRPPLDLARIRRLTSAWGVRSVVIDALRATHRRYGVDVNPLIDMLQQLPPPPLITRACCRLDRQEHRSYSVRLLTEALVSDRSWRGRIRYVAGARIPGHQWFGIPLTPDPVGAIRSVVGRRALRSATRAAARWPVEAATRTER